MKKEKIVGYSITHSPLWDGNPSSYLEKKLLVLTKDFFIKPTSKEMAVLNTLKTQESIDNAIFRIIDSHY